MSIVALGGNADVVPSLSNVFVGAAGELYKEKALAIADSAFAEAGAV
jgi:hypothetical protein